MSSTLAFSVLLAIVIVMSFIINYSANNIPSTQINIFIPTEKVIEKMEFYVPETNLQSGDILVFKITNTRSAPVVKYKNELLPTFNTNSGIVGITGIDLREKSASNNLTLDTGETKLSEIITITERALPTSKIILPTKLIEKGVKPADLIEKVSSSDKPSLDKALEIYTDNTHIKGTFLMPLKNWIDVGAYGNIRESPDGSILHLGVDLEGENGDSVIASNYGIVTYSGELPSFGNSIVIHHGQGIFTLYLHLSRIDVAKDEHISRGQEIGLVGSSGDYSLGPHLHFSVKIRGASVDPKRFIDGINMVLE